MDRLMEMEKYLRGINISDNESIIKILLELIDYLKDKEVRESDE